MAFAKWHKILAKFSTVIWQNLIISELAKLNGEFFAEHPVRQLFFAWLIKFGEIDPRSPL